MRSTPRPSETIDATALLVAVFGVALGGCDPLPPDAIRGPRKIVAGSAGACALWETAPMRCWGTTPFSTPSGALQSFARPGSFPDAADVTLESSGRISGKGCVIDRRGALECPLAMAGRTRGELPLGGTASCAIDRRGVLLCVPAVTAEMLVYPPLRSAPSMRDVRAPVIAEARVCIIARADGERDDAVWCRERVRVPLGAMTAVDDGWERVDLGGVASLALGPHRLCARLRSGRIRCFDFSRHQARDVDGITGAVQLVAGDDFGCARDALGGVYCFGEGGDGQLGDGALSARPVPLPAPATDLAAAEWRACAIVEGAPLCWGLLRREGAIAAVAASPPVRVADIGDLRQLALGRDFTCATRKADGSVRCWGQDADGQLGDGSMLPPPSSSRRRDTTASAEPARSGGPSVVRTGNAGRHPRWRLPLALGAALVVLTPLASVLALAHASIRRNAVASQEARIAVHGQGILAALLTPIALARALPGALALWPGQGDVLRFEGWWTARVALAVLGPVLALAVVTAGFFLLRRAKTDQLPIAARLGSAWLVAIAGPLLGAAMVVTPAMNEQTQEELIYVARDATLNLRPFFMAQELASVTWIVLVVVYALFTVAWAKAERA